MFRPLFLAALGALIIGAPPVHAADDTTTTDSAKSQRSPGQGFGHRRPIFADTDRLKSELQLTDEQAAQVAEVAGRYRPAPPSASSPSGGQRPPRPDPQKMTQMMSEVNALLSTEQQAKLKAIMVKERPPRPPADGGPSK